MLNNKKKLRYLKIYVDYQSRQFKKCQNRIMSNVKQIAFFSSSCIIVMCTAIAH